MEQPAQQGMEPQQIEKPPTASSLTSSKHGPVAGAGKTAEVVINGAQGSSK
jgi:hypothetical protein